MPRKGDVINLVGNKYGFWTVISYTGSKSKWLCECSCGGQRAVYSGHLKDGSSKSCGCLMPRGQNHKSFKHGMSETPEFKTWLQMLTRCHNPNSKSWKHYGARGIAMCDRWKTDFLSFYNDMGPKPSPSHSIDRIDVDRGYEPNNCRWATAKEQARNTSRTAWVVFQGRKISLAEACEVSGVNYCSAQERRAAGKDWRGNGVSSE